MIFRLLPGAIGLTLAVWVTLSFSSQKGAPKPVDTPPIQFPITQYDTTSLRSISQTALRAPEKLLFDVVWGGWSFRWVHAGQATLELLPTNSPHFQQIRSLAWCNSFFQTFYPVRDTLTSLIHSQGIYPLRFTKVLNEGSYHARSTSEFDQKAGSIRVDDTTFAIESFTHDVLSAFYYIRTQKLEVGRSFSLDAVSGRKKYKLTVICHKKETIQVPAGTFKTILVEPKLQGNDLFRARGTLLIWVTDDEHHIPVKMQSKIPVGSIKAELVSRS